MVFIGEKYFIFLSVYISTRTKIIHLYQNLQELEELVLEIYCLESFNNI